MSWKIGQVLFIFLFCTACFSVDNTFVCTPSNPSGFYTLQAGQAISVTNASQALNFSQNAILAFLQLNANGSASFLLFSADGKGTPQTFSGNWSTGGAKLNVNFQNGSALSGTLSEDFPYCILNFDSTSFPENPFSLPFGSQSTSVVLNILFQQYQQNINPKILAASYQSSSLLAISNTDNNITAKLGGNNPATFAFTTDGSSVSNTVNSSGQIQNDSGTFNITNNYTLTTQSSLGGTVSTYFYRFNQFNGKLTLVNYQGTYNFGSGPGPATFSGTYLPP